jgi:hypothetical protein
MEQQDTQYGEAANAVQCRLVRQPTTAGWFRVLVREADRAALPVERFGRRPGGEQRPVG